MTEQRPSAGYQFLIVALLSLNFGIVWFDRNAFGFLSPFVAPELSLTNAQVALIGSAMALTWAVSGLLAGAVTDFVGHRKLLLIAATVVFSLCSVLTGLASTFLLLIGARMLMGAAEGAVFPVSQWLTLKTVSEKHRGLAMGSMQTTGAAILGSFLAPIIVVALAEAFGWRSAFYIAGVPGLITALLMLVLIREPEETAGDAAAHAKPRADFSTLLSVFLTRNVLVCAGIAVCLVAYMLSVWLLMPLYLTDNGRFSPTTMSWLISMLGLATAGFGLLLPAASDRLGRKPVMIVAALVACILPLAALYGGTSVVLIALAFFVGWAFAGAFSIFMATIPSESVSPQYFGVAMGFVIACGEAIGGVFGPAAAGWAMDHFGRGVINWILLGLCLTAAGLSLLLKETAPKRKTAAAPAAEMRAAA